jgi:hypothetical protein
VILENEWDRLERTELPTGRSLGTVSTHQLVQHLDAALSSVPSCTDDQDLMLGHLRDLQPWRERLVGTESDLARLQVLVEAPRLSFSNGRKGSWTADSLPEVKDALKSAEAEREAVLAARVSEILEADGVTFMLALPAA